MPLDFSKIAATSTADTVASPRDIFSILPDKKPKYVYLKAKLSRPEIIVGAYFRNRHQ
jgi:hypothetical protein